MMPGLLARANRQFVLAAAGFVGTMFYLTSGRPPHLGTDDVRYKQNVDPSIARPSCRDLPGANETLVVMKTGSTEIRHKLPVHLSTTLRCYSDYLIFSDVVEHFEGETTIDALEDVDPSLKETHEDFELYRRLKQHGRSALEPRELSGPVSRPQGSGGKPTNAGWRLDKWKFLPMMRRTLEEYPEKKWYVFVETDTFIFWRTTLAYLSALDWTRPYYMGGQINIGDVEFAHGGSGYAVSRPALELVVKHYVENKRDWEEFTRNHWAGDCVLGKAFKDAGAPLTRAWPIWQGDDIGNMNYGRTDNSHRLWCHPTVSYHHLAPDVVKDLWDFEQGWALNGGEVGSRQTLFLGIVS